MSSSVYSFFVGAGAGIGVMFEAYPATIEEESALESDAGDSVTMVVASTALLLFPDSCAATTGLFELKSSSK